MLGTEGNVEGGTIQIAKYLTPSGFALSHFPGGSQILFCFLQCVHIRLDRYATENFNYCPCRSTHLHQMFSEVPLSLVCLNFF